MQVLCNANQSASLNFQKSHETETMAEGNDSNLLKIDSLTYSLRTHNELIVLKLKINNIRKYQKIPGDIKK